MTIPAAVPGSASASASGPGVRAGGTWGPVHGFERYPHGESVVADRRGVLTVAWGSQQGWPEPVKVEQRTAAGRWRAPVTLGAGFAPVVGADAAGNVTVAWCRDRKGFPTGVWAARKPRGKPWTRPVHLTRDVAAPGTSLGDATNLRIAVQASGAALVTWERVIGKGNVVQAAYRPSDGPWGTADSLSSPTAYASNARAAFAPHGRAWVAYERSAGTGPSRVKVRSRSTTGHWSLARRVGVGSLGEVGATRSADVTVVFRHHDRVWAGVRDATTRVWGAPVPVTPPGVHLRAWSAALSRSGAALVAYLWKRGRVDVVRRDTRGAWTRPTTLVERTGRVAGVLAATNPGGDMFASWDNNYGIYGRYRPAGQRWLPTTTPHPDVGQVDVLEAVRTTVAPGGNVVALWAQEERPLRVRVLNVP